MRFKKKQLVELDIASKEEINIVETKLAGFYVLWHQNTGSAEDNLSGEITETRGNLRENTSLGTDVARRNKTTHSQEKESADVDRRHATDESNVSRRNFDLNKKIMYEEIKMNPTLVLKELAEFLGFPFSREEEDLGVVDEILKLCSFDNLSNLEVNNNGKMSFGVETKLFFCLGQVGDSKNCLTLEMIEK
ncbi:hypothetical protein PIB30_058461 [Stylosanthes scabra]|uniref:Sulfotransferase n=1 Tax=Stylosanthes scabra TaxID=79078 RepID=A0ABU6VIG8_9FABA|nr:hypothetical protein [Stylosanthes scabra]